MNKIIELMKNLSLAGEKDQSSSGLLPHLDMSLATLKRELAVLVLSGDLLRMGKGPATRYRLSEKHLVPPPAELEERDSRDLQKIPKDFLFLLSKESESLLRLLSRPLGLRQPVSYKRDFLEKYRPNESFLLPKEIARELGDAGKLRERLPAATYARKVLEQLLIDLSYSSSKLEGNRYSLLATEELFKLGADRSDLDAVMLLNHKSAIEFMVDAVPEHGLSSVIVRNLHSLLMQDLLDSPMDLGEIRKTVVNISDSVYIPLQIPQQISEFFEKIMMMARNIKNPIEAAFFLWVHIAYLQPFIDGNKRTSRLAANIPLMLYNAAPLSFLGVDANDYAFAMMGVYENRDVSIAIDLFAATYRRSIEKYSAVLDSMGSPDPIRIKYRELLGSFLQKIVREEENLEYIKASIDIPAEEKNAFLTILERELKGLSTHNCARYRLRISEVERWLSKR